MQVKASSLAMDTPYLADKQFAVILTQIRNKVVDF